MHICVHSWTVYLIYEAAIYTGNWICGLVPCCSRKLWDLEVYGCLGRNLFISYKAGICKSVPWIFVSMVLCRRVMFIPLRLYNVFCVLTTKSYFDTLVMGYKLCILLIYPRPSNCFEWICHMVRNQLKK